MIAGIMLRSSLAATTRISNRPNEGTEEPEKCPCPSLHGPTRLDKHRVLELG